jgi:hypothetical protein
VNRERASHALRGPTAAVGAALVGGGVAMTCCWLTSLDVPGTSRMVAWLATAAAAAGGAAAGSGGPVRRAALGAGAGMLCALVSSALVHAAGGPSTVSSALVIGAGGALVSALVVFAASIVGPRAGLMIAGAAIGVSVLQGDPTVVEGPLAPLASLVPDLWAFDPLPAWRLGLSVPPGQLVLAAANAAAWWLALIPAAALARRAAP